MSSNSVTPPSLAASHRCADDGGLRSANVSPTIVALEAPHSVFLVGVTPGLSTARTAMFPKLLMTMTSGWPVLVAAAGMTPGIGFVAVRRLGRVQRFLRTSVVRALGPPRDPEPCGRWSARR